MAGAGNVAIRQFNRYELKYLVHSSQVPRIVDDLSRQMTPDLHGDASGSYIITSLYYDSAGLHMFHSKLIGANYRRKLRVRVYGKTPEDPDNIAMAEIKQRLARTTQKRRVLLPLGEAFQLCAGKDTRHWQDPEDARVAAEISALVQSMQLRPTCTISYRRRAFVGSRFEPGLRVTFDSDIWVGPPKMDLHRSSISSYLIPRDWSILEIKVDEKVPSWVCELISRHKCEIRRVSKYCLGIATLRGFWTGEGLWRFLEEMGSPVDPAPLTQSVEIRSGAGS
jgi:SPX domain protein involved in polyphosphate accumulation